MASLFMVLCDLWLSFISLENLTCQKPCDVTEYINSKAHEWKESQVYFHLCGLWGQRDYVPWEGESGCTPPGWTS